MQPSDNYKIENLIGIYPNLLSSEYCNKVIRYFEHLNSYDLTFNRQEIDRVSLTSKNDQQYFLGEELDDNRLLTNSQLASVAATSLETAASFYANNVYGITELAKNLQLMPFKLQRTKPGQGYHVWHHEQNNMQESHRLISVIAYLNNVEEGGETEFIHQQCRYAPRQGTVLLFPSSFTHTHRGNPPIKDTKYILASWFGLTK